MEKQALNTNNEANCQQPKMGFFKQVFAPFAGLSTMDTLRVIYFIISFFSLSVGLDTPTIYIVLIIANFANAARVVSKVKLTE